jgi:hypothetical protein
VTFWETTIAAGPRLWGLLIAGPMISLMLIGMVLVLWLGGWSAASEHQRLWYLGCTSLLLGADLAVVITALAAAKVSIKGPGDMHIDADASATGAPGTTTIKTEVTNR